VDLIILIVICVINLSLGAIIFFRAPRLTTSRLFGLMSVLVTVWLGANYLTDHFVGSNLIINDVSNRVAYMAAFGAVMSSLWFTYHFPVRHRIKHKEAVAVLLGAILIFVLSPMDYIAGTVYQNPEGLTFTPGILSGLYLLGFILALGLLVRNLLHSAKVSSINSRRQAHLMMVAFCVSGVVGLSTNVVLPMLGFEWNTTRLGPLSALILVGITAYAIVRHGLFDIRLAIVRSATYGLSIISLALLYMILAMSISAFFFGSHQQAAQNPISVVLGLVVAFSFQPVKKFFDKITSRVFFQDSYDSDDFFARLNKTLTATPDLHALLEGAATEIVGTLKAEQGYFFVNLKDGRHILTGTKGHSRLLLRDARVLDEYVSVHGDGMIAREELPSGHAIAGMMTRHKIALILPLVRAEQIIGYMCLGYRQSNRYTRRDVMVIETVSDQLVIAIQNALAVQEIKMFNETLQQRIDEATKELRASNAQLQKLDEAKDEFVSMASHQLRTPLTSVKGYLSMVLEGDAGKISDAQQHLLSEAFTSSERMVHLINDFLNVSRLQTGKFMVDRRQIDLAKVTEQEVDSLKTTAKVRNLKLSYKKPTRFPLLYIDEGKIRQVIMNFIDNAIYYSSEFSTITIALERVDGEVILTVHNEGMGVPESEKGHLFTKFFRATNARKQRPDGTGVGLFLSKMVVTAHGGKMVFDSAQNEGATFGFRLPIKKLSTPPVDEID
jgi:signal transduction histidine kinase